MVTDYRIPDQPSTGNTISIEISRPLTKSPSTTVRLAVPEADADPLANDGKIQIETANSVPKEIRIHQLQVEQDTGKSQSIGDEVLVDLNRAGTGLMEIVTEPDMR